MKRFCTILLTAAVLLTAIPAVCIAAIAEDDTIEAAYQTGDIIEFGTYPQTKVTDEAIISALDAIEKEWVSYGYYRGTGISNDGSMTTSDYMWHADIIFDGITYRAVQFSQFRPSQSYLPIQTGGGVSYQDENDYYINNIYYFRFEPLQWRVLDANEGLLISERIIDSQAYNNYFLQSNNEVWGDENQTYYASDYANSSIREWLNDVFYITAFDSSQQLKIKNTQLENKSIQNNEYDSTETDDNIFLLSYWDLKNTGFGFSTQIDKRAHGTDYAKCQGLDTFTDSNYNTYDGKDTADWWLRSVGGSSRDACCVDERGNSNVVSFICITSTGVRPAITLDIKALADTSGACGENASWSFDKANGNLVITGSGATDSHESFDDYGWYSFKDSIEYVEIGDGITSLGANAFSACTNLKEVYCGDKLVDIGDNAFSGCSNLSTITFNSERISANNAFDSDAKLKIISPQNNSDARSLSAALNAEYIPYAFGEDSILSFNSTLHADSRSDYHFLTNLINKYKDAQYVHFKKLVFDDVKNVKVEAFDDIIIIDRGSDSFALNDLYINISVISDGRERNIKFAEMIELLEKGEYDAFKLNIKSEEEETEKTIFQKIGEFFNDIKEDLIKAVSKTINFFVRIFKRR